MARLRQLWEGLHSSFWFLPTCLVVAAGFLAIGLVEVDHRLETDLEEELPRVFAVSAEGAQGMLQAIATSMITVAGVIFSITILILSEVSNQYSPRILRNFVRDRKNQVVLGVFLAIFVYCLVVLRSIYDVGEEKFIPQIAVLGGIGLSLAGIGVLIFFIHHIAYSIQASTILQRATAETLAEINILYPQTVGIGPAETPAAPPDDILDQNLWHVVKATQSGYLEMTGGEALSAFAEDYDTVVRLEYLIGDFVVEETPLASVYGKDPPSEGAARRLRRAISIISYRTIEQDASFGIRQLVDVALKALSPSLNDTTTAIMCVDHLTTILGRLIQRKMESPYRIKDGQLRVIAGRPGFGDLLTECVEQIRQNASGNVAVLHRLIHALVTVIPLTRDRSRHEEIRRQLSLIRKTIQVTVSFAQDRGGLLLACDRAEAALLEG